MNNHNSANIPRIFHLNISSCISLLALIVALLVLGACATAKPKSIIKDFASNSKLGADSTILIIRPVTYYERIYDEQKLDSSLFNGEVVAKRFYQAAGKAVKSRKYNLLKSGIRRELQEEGVQKEIRSNANKITRGILNSETKHLLKSLAAKDKSIAVLVNLAYVTVGPGGTRTRSGAIKSSMSKTVFYSTLIDCSKEEVVWKGGVLLREMPNPSTELFYESLALLYKNFPELEGRQ